MLNYTKIYVKLYHIMCLYQQQVPTTQLHMPLTKCKYNFKINNFISIEYVIQVVLIWVLRETLKLYQKLSWFLRQEITKLKIDKKLNIVGRYTIHNTQHLYIEIPPTGMYQVQKCHNLSYIKFSAPPLCILRGKATLGFTRKKINL